jgi:hypothetical protein
MARFAGKVKQVLFTFANAHNEAIVLHSDSTISSSVATLPAAVVTISAARGHEQRNIND